MNIVLSTSCVFPNTETGFRLASEFGCDGIELMVNHEKRSQSPEAMAKLARFYKMPIMSIHCPCLVVTQPVWGWNPQVKLLRSVEMAQQVGARSVVVHPPFIWQRMYAESFADFVNRLNADLKGEVTVCVENMYGVTRMGKNIEPYLCTDDPALGDFDAICLDTSHAAASRWDPVDLYRKMDGRVRHVHLSDSTSTRGDEHLPPGLGTLPLEELAEVMIEDGFTGDIVLEIAVSKVPDSQRDEVLRDAVVWTRKAFHL